MEDGELESLLRDLESDRVERKAALTQTDRIREAICAFANDLAGHGKPGVLVIGLNDDGSCAGVPITDELLRTLADMRSDGNITPFPVMTVQKRTLLGCEIAAVVVQPSDAPPVRYKGRVCVRVGPRRSYASADEERRLSERRKARDLPFDLQVIPSAQLQDLDLDLFQREYLPSSLPPDILSENQRSPAEQLSSMRFATAGQDPKPTALGMLVIGKEPTRYLPGAYIQFLRLDGHELTDPIKDSESISGPLAHVLRKLDEKVRAHVMVASDLTSQFAEVRHSDYPVPAIHQLTANAVLHRNYEGTNAPVRIYWFNDRIEIMSPGGPFGQVSRENFGRPGVTDYRNPHLAEAMKNLGYVQKFGVGIQIARKELEKNGNPPLQFTVEESSVLAVLRRKT